MRSCGDGGRGRHLHSLRQVSRQHDLSNLDFRERGMRLVAVTEHPTGRRLHLLERRTHHGDWGLAAILAGLIACALDWRDRREWLHFRRELAR